MGEVEKPDAAEGWLGKLEDKGLKAHVVSYNTVIRARAKFGRPDAAEQRVVKLEDQGLEADVVSYNS